MMNIVDWDYGDYDASDVGIWHQYMTPVHDSGTRHQKQVGQDFNLSCETSIAKIDA